MALLDSVKNLKGGNVALAAEDPEMRAVIIVLIMVLVGVLLYASRQQAKTGKPELKLVS